MVGRPDSSGPRMLSSLPLPPRVLRRGPRAKAAVGLAPDRLLPVRRGRTCTSASALASRSGMEAVGAMWRAVPEAGEGGTAACTALQDHAHTCTQARGRSNREDGQ
jgi:hypothetical protein